MQLPIKQIKTENLATMTSYKCVVIGSIQLNKLGTSNLESIYNQYMKIILRENTILFL